MKLGRYIGIKDMSNLPNIVQRRIPVILKDAFRFAKNVKNMQRGNRS